MAQHTEGLLLLTEERRGPPGPHIIATLVELLEYLNSTCNAAPCAAPLLRRYASPDTRTLTVNAALVSAVAPTVLHANGVGATVTTRTVVNVTGKVGCCGIFGSFGPWCAM